MITQVVKLTFELHETVCAACLADLMEEAIAAYLDAEFDNPITRHIHAVTCSVGPDSPIDPEHMAKIRGLPQ